ncbi:MAG: type II secretion system protein, partial [Bdellovibrionales bacterium]|nr:type II secretion system protein [Bdellovibrionales bacterium]
MPIKQERDWRSFVQKSESGFTLIEALMVTAIIGILAALAIPNYNRMQRRAWQKEGQALMSEYYRLAKVMTAEYGFDPGNFVGTGFNPEGPLNYNLRAAQPPSPSDDVPSGYPTNTACLRLNAPGSCSGFNYVPKWTTSSNMCNPTPFEYS